MKREAITDWIQILATIGVIVGLILVTIELRQNSRMARADMNSQMLIHQQTLYGALRDPDFALVFGKSLEQPDALLLEEILVMDGYYRDLLGLLIRERQMISRGIFDDDSMYVARQVVSLGLGTEYGQEWWAQNKDGFFRSVVSQIDEALEEAQNGEIRVFY